MGFHLKLLRTAILKTDSLYILILLYQSMFSSCIPRNVYPVNHFGSTFIPILPPMRSLITNKTYSFRLQIAYLANPPVFWVIVDLSMC